MRTTTARRSTVLLAVVLVAGLGACTAEEGPDLDGAGGPDSTVPAESTPTADVEAAVRQAVTRFQRVADRNGQGPDKGTVTPALLDVATRDWAREITGNYRRNVLAAGNVAVGRTKVTVRSVDLESGRASVEACVDGTGVYVVEQGEAVQPGDVSSGRLVMTYELEHTEETWKVAGVEGDGTTC